MSRGRRRNLGGVDRLPSGRWRVRLAEPNTSSRISIGTFRTKSEAEAAFAKAVSDQHRGAWVVPEDWRMTLAEYAPAWIASRLTSRGEPVRPRVREVYEGYLRLHIIPSLGTVPLARLTTSGVRRWYADLLAGGLGPSTAAKCYRLLRAILNTAVEDRHLVTNPCAIKGAGVEPCEERAIPSLAEVYALAEAVTPRYRALVLLAAFGGLRRGELFALKRQDIDLLHRTVDIRSLRQESRTGKLLTGPPKTAAGRRTLALPAELVPELEEHLARWTPSGPSSLVFVGEKGAPVRAGVWQKEGPGATRAGPSRPAPPRPAPRCRDDGGRDRRRHEGDHAPPRSRDPGGGTALPARHRRTRSGACQRHRPPYPGGAGRSKRAGRVDPLQRRARRTRPDLIGLGRTLGVRGWADEES